MELTRKLLYKEKTNVFAYYIVTSILLSNYSYFLSWCYENNMNLLEFTKTLSNLQDFEMVERFIYQKYLHYVVTYEKFLDNLVNNIENGKDVNIVNNKKGDQDYEEKKHLFYTARMTICEL